VLGTWNSANVPNVDYVGRLLNDYYPNTNEPASLTGGPKAAAVQAAIWYFTDKYVLRADDPLHAAVPPSWPMSSTRGRWSSRQSRASRSPRRP
jgi:TQXA domain-containing protein